MSETKVSGGLGAGFEHKCDGSGNVIDINSLADKKQGQKPSLKEIEDNPELRIRPERITSSPKELEQALHQAGLIDTNARWQHLALCGQADPELFFSENGRYSVEAMGICAVCPVIPQCLDFHLNQTDEGYGVFAALGSKDRRYIYRSARDLGKGAYGLALETLFKKVKVTRKPKKRIPLFDDKQRDLLVQYGIANNIIDPEADYGYDNGITA